MTNTNDYRVNWKKLQITQEGEGTIVHPLVALMFAPIMGLLFLMFLPFIGFYLTLSAGCKGLYHLQAGLFEHVTAPAPATGAAHLVGHEPANPDEISEDLKKLDEEIQARRAE